MVELLVGGVIFLAVAVVSWRWISARDRGAIYSNNARQPAAPVCIPGRGDCLTGYPGEHGEETNGRHGVGYNNLAGQNEHNRMIGRTLPVELPGPSGRPALPDGEQPIEVEWRPVEYERVKR